LARDFSGSSWAVILGGSSGFGLATARKLAENGMNLCIVHRDRRGAMRRIEPEFEKLRGLGVGFHSWNADAVDPDRRTELLDEMQQAIGEDGRVRVLLHSIAFGNLKLLVPEKTTPRAAAGALADRLGIDPQKVQEAVRELFSEHDEDALFTVTDSPVYSQKNFLEESDFSRTILCMGTSLLGWTQGLHQRGLFADDARVFGLTSEGNTLAWKGYAAVSAAKVALEALARSIAVEFAPYGVRCNVIQAGVTEPPALQAIPGSDQLKANARLRNPFGRLTTPRDVANAIYLLSLDEAAWINGDVIRVDGGEHVSGAMR